MSCFKGLFFLFWILLSSAVGAQNDSTKNGKFRLLDSSQQLVFSGKYVDGTRHGIFKEYDSQGLLVSKSKYRKGKLMWMQLYKNGKVYAFIDKKGVYRKKKDCGC